MKHAPLTPNQSNPEEMKKERQHEQFMKWVTGEKGAEFPYFKDFTDVKMPNI